MALLHLFNCTAPSLSSPPSSSSPSAITATTHLLKLHSGSSHPKSFNGLRSFSLPIKKRGNVIVKASSEVDSTGPDSVASSPDAAKEEAVVPVENLPLESKVQTRTEQQLKMRLAKKIRLRRKRLVRKRHLRKKGRWPPSKMKKNKNV